MLKYLEVSDDVWFDLSEEERFVNVDKFNSLKVKDVFSGKKLLSN